MNGRTLRRMVAMMGLSLVVGVAPAWAGRGAGPAARRPAGLLVQARALLGELLALARIAPAGRFTAASGKDSGDIDPNDLPVASPPRCAAGGDGCPGESAEGDGDSSVLIDPDGYR